MKHIKSLAVLVALLAAGLGLACSDTTTPTQLAIPLDEGKSHDDNWHIPPPCPPGLSPQFAHGCIPEVPPPPPVDRPPA